MARPNWEDTHPELLAEAKALRAEGWTQQQIAARFGVSQPTISMALNPELREAQRKARYEKYQSDPEYREAQRKAAREGQRKKYQSDPEYREAQAARRRKKYQSDPEWAEARAARRREKYHSDPEFREARRAYQREKYQSDPEYREAKSARAAARRRAYDRADPGKHFKEGGLSIKDVRLTVRERSSGFRQAVLARWGLECYGCGVANVPWLHAHHLEQLAEGERVSTAEDGRPLCPTCHAMVHYFAKPPAKMLSMDDLRHLLQWLRNGGHLPED